MVVRALSTPIHMLGSAVVSVITAVIVVGIRVVIGSLTEIPLRVLVVFVPIMLLFKILDLRVWIIFPFITLLTPFLSLPYGRKMSSFAKHMI